jgi:hypothetical protein
MFTSEVLASKVKRDPFERVGNYEDGAEDHGGKPRGRRRDDGRHSFTLRVASERGSSSLPFEVISDFKDIEYKSVAGRNVDTGAWQGHKVAG